MIPITSFQFSKINRLIQLFSLIFALEKYDFRLIFSSKFDIKLSSDISINLRPYRSRDKEVFTILEKNSELWHIRMRFKDTYKTAFVAQNDHYEWLLMPFGLRNALAIFQRTVHNLLKKHNLIQFCKNHLEDIVIHSKKINQHLLYLKQVFKALRVDNADCLSRNFFQGKDFQICLRLISWKKNQQNLSLHHTKKNAIQSLKRHTLTKIYVPLTFQQKFIERAHESFGYIDTQKLMNLISPCYIWSSIKEDVVAHYRGCKICIRNKTMRRKELEQSAQLGSTR